MVKVFQQERVVFTSSVEIYRGQRKTLSYCLTEKSSGVHRGEVSPGDDLRVRGVDVRGKFEVETWACLSGATLSKNHRVSGSSARRLRPVRTSRRQDRARFEILFLCGGILPHSDGTEHVSNCQSPETGLEANGRFEHQKTVPAKARSPSGVDSTGSHELIVDVTVQHFPASLMLFTPTERPKLFAESLSLAWPCRCRAEACHWAWTLRAEISCESRVT